MADFEYDGGETVRWQGLGGDIMTLPDAVRKFRELPSQNRVHVLVYRERGKEPPSFDVNDLEVLVQELGE